MNRYKIARLISEKLNELMKSQGLLNKSFNVRLVAEKHLADRVIDRKIEMQSLYFILNRLFCKHMCQLLYAAEMDLIKTGKDRSGTIAVSYRDYTLCLTSKKHSENEYTFKIRTLMWHSKSNNFTYKINLD